MTKAQRGGLLIHEREPGAKSIAGDAMEGAMGVPRAADPLPIFQRHGTPDDLKELDKAEVESFIQIVRDAKDNPVSRKGIKPADVSATCFLHFVHFWRRRRFPSDPELLLRLLEAVLDFHGMTPGALGLLGFPKVDNGDNHARFIEAVDHEAAAARAPNAQVRRGPGQKVPGSISDLARKAGVRPATIRRWRAMPEWGERSRLHEQRRRDWWIKRKQDELHKFSRERAKAAILFLTQQEYARPLNEVTASGALIEPVSEWARGDILCRHDAIGTYLGTFAPTNRNA